MTLRPSTPSPGLATATFVAATFLFAACLGGPRVTGTGPLVDDERNLLAFDEVELDAGLNLSLMQGERQRVVVAAQREVQPIISTEVQGGKLKIKLEGNTNMDGGTNVQIVLPALEKLTVASSSNSIVRGFTGDKLVINLKGSGNTAVEEVSYDKLTIDLDGSGDADLSGRAEELEVMHDASGDVDAFELLAKDVTIKSKGSGSIRVSASGKLDAELKGSGDVLYRGDPELLIKDDGSGGVKKDE